MHVEVCKTHMKLVGGTCVLLGEGFYQFMVGNICAISLCDYLVEIWGGTVSGGGWTAFLGKQLEAKGVGLTRAVRCTSYWYVHVPLTILVVRWT